VATKKKTAERVPDADEHVVRTATHTITRNEQGVLISCTENESGDEVDVPLELRHLAN
jgi:hypothetical protein